MANPPYRAARGAHASARSAAEHGRADAGLNFPTEYFARIKCFGEAFALARECVGNYTGDAAAFAPLVDFMNTRIAPRVQHERDTYCLLQPIATEHATTVRRAREILAQLNDPTKNMPPGVRARQDTLARILSRPAWIDQCSLLAEAEELAYLLAYHHTGVRIKYNGQNYVLESRRTRDEPQLLADADAPRAARRDDRPPRRADDAPRRADDRPQRGRSAVARGSDRVVDRRNWKSASHPTIYDVAAEVSEHSALPRAVYVPNARPSSPDWREPEDTAIKIDEPQDKPNPRAPTPPRTGSRTPSSDIWDDDDETAAYMP